MSDWHPLGHTDEGSWIRVFIPLDEWHRARRRRLLALAHHRGRHLSAMRAAYRRKVRS